MNLCEFVFVLRSDGGRGELLRMFDNVQIQRHVILGNMTQ